MSMDRSSREEINTETSALNNTLNQMGLINIYVTFHPKAAECTFFSSTYGTFFRRAHMSNHKTSLNKFKNLNHQASFPITMV